MRNTTKVNPSTGIDFSKIRKYQGGNVITNTVWSDPTTTEESFWTTYNPTVIERWKQILQDSTFQENGKFNYNKANEFIKQYGNLRAATKYNGDQAVKGDGIKKYQQDYHNYWGFGNGDEFWKFTHGNNGSLGYGDVRASNGQDFVGDDYFGAQTAHRQATFFTPEEAEQLKSAAAAQGLQLVELADGYKDDKRKTYVFEPLSASTDQTATTTNNDQTATSTDQTTTTANINTEHPGTRVIDYGKDLKFDFKPDPWIEDPLHLHGIGLQNELAYRKDRELEYQKPVHLEVPDYRYSKVSSGFAQQQALQKQANAIKANAQRNLTSDPVLNQKLLSQANANASQYDDKAAQIKEYYEDLSRQRVNADTQYNLQQQVNTANTNDKNIVAKITSNRNADQAYNEQSNANKAALAQLLGNSWAQSKTDNKNNYAEYLNQYNKVLASRFLNAQEDVKAYNEFYNGDFDSKSPAMTAILQDAVAHWEDDEFYDSLSADEKTEYENMQNMDVETMRTYIKEHPNSTIAEYAKAAYQKKLKELEKRYQAVQDVVKQEMDRLALQQRVLTTSEGYTNYKPTEEQLFNMNLQIPINKQGGKSRFLEWAEHNRKVVKDVDARTTAAQRNATQLLKQKLDNINKETIVLLRAIFQ